MGKENMSIEKKSEQDIMQEMCIFITLTVCLKKDLFLRKLKNRNHQHYIKS